MKNKKSIIVIIFLLIIIITIIVINITFKKNNYKSVNENVISTNTTNNELVDTNEEDIDVRYTYTYGEIFKMENNIIYYGDTEAEKENDYLSQKIPENSKIINYENEEIISINDIEVGDYITLYVPTPE